MRTESAGTRAIGFDRLAVFVYSPFITYRMMVWEVIIGELVAERSGKSVRLRPFRNEIVHGEPYQVGERALIPVARIRSFRRARGTVGPHHFGGWGVGAAHITPVAVIERSELGERIIPVVDATASALGRMIAWAAAITLCLVVIRRQARRRRA